MAYHGHCRRHYRDEAFEIVNSQSAQVFVNVLSRTSVSMYTARWIGLDHYKFWQNCELRY